MNKEQFIKSMNQIGFKEDEIINLSSSFDSINNYNSELFISYENMFKNGDDFFYIFDTMHNDFKNSTINVYTLDLVLLIILSEQVKEKYIKENISIDVFYETMKDLLYKLKECLLVYKVYGTFVYWWYDRIYAVKIFKIGRLEYELTVFDGEYNKNGISLKSGDSCITIHIPNSGEKLTIESVNESIEEAKKFFKNRGELYPIVCASWLLYPKNLERYKVGSNLYNFYKLFDIYRYKDHEGYDELWRVFDTVIDENNIDNLKNDTSLRRTFINVIKNKEKIGEGDGVLIKQ